MLEQRAVAAAVACLGLESNVGGRVLVGDGHGRGRKRGRCLGGMFWARWLEKWGWWNSAVRTKAAVAATAAAASAAAAAAAAEAVATPEGASKSRRGCV